MILEGVSYSAYIQLCRVILSRTGTLLWPVFNLTLSGLDVRLDRSLCPILFAVNTFPSTSSSPKLLSFPSGEGV